MRVFNIRVIMGSMLNKGKVKFKNGIKKKELGKLKFFSCEDFSHYVRKFP